MPLEAAWDKGGLDRVQLLTGRSSHQPSNRPAWVVRSPKKGSSMSSISGGGGHVAQAAYPPQVASPPAQPASQPASQPAAQGESPPELAPSGNLGTRLHEVG